MEIKARFLNAPQGSFFLFGPRGTGKSTWLEQTYHDGVRIDLLNGEAFRRLSARPERLVEFIPSDSTRVIIDEIQKIPELLSEVHKLMEQRRGLQFVLTGSSARKLKRAGTDLLAGRAVLAYSHPFMASELPGEFTLAKALEFGTVPVVWMASTPRETLQSYVTAYLREEVQNEGLVRNLSSFYRFLEAASFSHGSVLNLNEVARDCEVGRSTVEGYFSILKDLLICSELPVFTKRAKRRMVAHGKFYFFDTGVFRAFRPAGPLDRPSEIEGAALEGLVWQHLRAMADYSGGGTSLYYWRTVGGLEIDFVVYGKGVFSAIEVKNEHRIRAENLKALRAFGEDYPEAERLLLYRGDHEEEIDGIRCIPVEKYLLTLVPSFH